MLPTLIIDDFRFSENDTGLVMPDEDAGAGIELLRIAENGTRPADIDSLFNVLGYDLSETGRYAGSRTFIA